MYRVSDPQAVANCAVAAALTTHFIASSLSGLEGPRRVEAAQATVVGGMAVAVVAGTYAALVPPEDIDGQFRRRLFAGGVSALFGPLVGVCLRRLAYGVTAYPLSIAQGLAYGARGASGQLALAGLGALVHAAVYKGLRGRLAA